MSVTVAAAISGSIPSAVLVDVSSSPTVTAQVQVFRVHDDGSRHRVLSTSRVLVGSWSGLDYHAPFNRIFRYVAVAEGQAESAATADLFVPSDAAWLVHPSDPALSFPVEKILAPQQPVTYSVRAAAFDILPNPAESVDALPVIRNDSTRSGPVSRMMIQVSTTNLAQALACFRSGGPILLNGAWGAQDYPWQWFHARDIQVSNAAGNVQFPTRNIDFETRACRQPDSDVKPIVTLDDVKALGSFDTVKATYADFRAMLLGIES